jgi:hypothetical protein
MAKSKKKTKIEINREIEKNNIERARYLAPLKSSVEFIAPVESQLTRGLFMDVPFYESKELGLHQPKKFYLDPAEIEKLEKLFLEFDIPETMWHDLKFSWLNMVFAAKIALRKDQIERDQNAAMEDFIRAFELVKEISTEDKLVREFSITWKQKKEDGNWGAENTTTFKTHIASNLLMDLLSSYKHSKQFSTFSSMYGQFKDANPITLTLKGNRKNSKSDRVNFYSIELYKYLRSCLFEPPYGLVLDEDGWKEYMAYYKNQGKKYPDRRLYLFIGRLMVLAELTDDVEGEISEIGDGTIRERIRKKIEPYLAAQKANYKS